jgi:hypothetical protein
MHLIEDVTETIVVNWSVEKPRYAPSPSGWLVEKTKDKKQQKNKRQAC